MLRIFSHDLYDPGSVLQLLPVYAGAEQWDIGMIKDENILVLVKLNPLVYIVNGYRNAIYGGEWFFEHFYSSTYFWIFTVTLFCVSSLIFKRLKVPFADVL